MEKESKETIVVKLKDVNEYGCPYCGYRSYSMTMSAHYTAILVCGECKRQFLAFDGEGTVSGIGLGVSDETGETFYPKVQEHPRKGTPSHGAKDEQPESGGEFFNSRGIGVDFDLPCFVCGGEKKTRANISGSACCKAAGERIVKMFRGLAKLDYRPSEPDYVQVKVGACKHHEEELNRLDKTLGTEGIVTAAGIKLAIGENGYYEIIDSIKENTGIVDINIARALCFIYKYGGIDGSDHKAWTIDQVVRCLTVDKYDQFVSYCKDGEDGPNTYDWDTGTAP